MNAGRTTTARNIDRLREKLTAYRALYGAEPTAIASGTFVDVHTNEVHELGYPRTVERVDVAGVIVTIKAGGAPVKVAPAGGHFIIL